MKKIEFNPKEPYDPNKHESTKPIPPHIIRLQKGILFNMILLRFIRACKFTSYYQIDSSR